MSVIQLIPTAKPCDAVLASLVRHFLKVYRHVEPIGSLALSADDKYGFAGYVSQASAKVERVGDVWQVTVDYKHKMSSSQYLLGVFAFIALCVNDRFGWAIILAMICVVGPAFLAKRKEERISEALQAAKAELS